MAKSPSAKEDEDLRGELRSLIKENKSLRRRVKALEKARHIWEDTSHEKDEPEEVPVSLGTICPACKRDYLKTLDLIHTKMRYCDMCKFREKIK